MTEAKRLKPDRQQISALPEADTRSRPVSYSHLLLRRFLRHRLAVFSLFILAGLAMSAILAPKIAQDPEKINLRQKLQVSSAAHILGTDDLGRDMLARILYGGRISLSVGIMATGLSLVVGSIIGLLSGYYGGWLDNLLMRLTDMFLSFPSLFVLILLGAMLKDTRLAAFRGGMLTIVLVIALLSWMTTARLVRGAVLTLRELDYIEATRALGGSNFRLILNHILPNAMGPIIVRGALQTAYSILTESGLSYLGFGIQPPTPTWGNMLNSAQTYMRTNPSMAIYPGLAIFITVIAVNFIGDGLRDAFDPRTFYEQ